LLLIEILKLTLVNTKQGGEKMDWTTFTPPHTSVLLPSKGRFNSDHEDEDVKSGWVKIRQYAAPEESLMASMNSENSNRVVNDIIDNCLKEGTVKVEDLTDQDAFYLIVWLRANSYSSAYELSVICPFCSYEPSPESLYIYDLANLKVDYLDKEIKEPGEILLPTSGLKVGLVELRRSDIIKARDRLEEVIKYKGIQGDPFELIKRARSIKSVFTPDGEQVSDYPTIEELCLYYLPSKDGLFIDQERREMFGHGVDLNIKVSCDGCGKEIQTRLPATIEEFFRPYRVLPSPQNDHAFGDPVSVSGGTTRWPISEDSSPNGEENPSEDVETNETGQEGE